MWERRQFREQRRRLWWLEVATVIICGFSPRVRCVNILIGRFSSDRGCLGKHSGHVLLEAKSAWLPGAFIWTSSCVQGTTGLHLLGRGLFSGVVSISHLCHVCVARRPSWRREQKWWLLPTLNGPVNLRLSVVEGRSLVRRRVIGLFGSHLRGDVHVSIHPLLWVLLRPAVETVQLFFLRSSLGDLLILNPWPRACFLHNVCLLEVYPARGFDCPVVLLKLEQRGITTPYGDPDLFVSRVTAQLIRTGRVRIKEWSMARLDWCDFSWKKQYFFSLLVGSPIFLHQSFSNFN